MATSKKPESFQTNYLKLDIDLDKSVYLYSVDASVEKSANSDVRKEFKIPRAIKVALVGKLLAERHVQYHIYDGDKKLFVPTKLPSDLNHIEVELDNRPETYRLRFVLAKEIRLSALNSEEPLEPINMLNMAFRNHLTQNNRYALVKKGLYDTESRGSELGNGLMFDFGFYQSVKRCQAGWMLVTDISACVFHKPGGLMDYLTQADRRIRADKALNEETWRSANDLLKGVNVLTTHNEGNTKLYRIQRLSRESANDFKFTVNGEERTVAGHFAREYTKLRYPHLPCVLVGDSRRPIAFPLEVCKIPSAQPYLKNLSTFLKAKLTKSTALKPGDRLQRIKNIIKENHESYDPAFMLSFGIKVSNKPNTLMTIDQKVLPCRSVIYNQGRGLFTSNGQWRMGNQRLIATERLDNWAIVYQTIAFKSLDQNFKPHLIQALERLGISDKAPKVYSSEGLSVQGALEPLIGQNYQLVMFVVDDADSYQQVKQLADKNYGMLSQCVNYTKLAAILGDERKLATYCENLSLKINAKLGGKNQSVNQAHLKTIRLDNGREPVMFLGADVTHFGSGSSKKSITAVVGSKDLGFLQYCCRLSEQDNPDERKESQELILEFEEMAHALIKIFIDNNGVKPTRIIFYRDGVDSGQVQKLVEFEIFALKKACERLGFTVMPKITLILVLKRHHTRLFPMGSQSNKSGNIPSGSYADAVITSPQTPEFYLCGQDSFLGTAKAANYQVILDENNFKMIDIINLSYDLCHLYVSSTKAVSLPAPLYYAHLAAFRGRLYDEDQETDDHDSDSDGEDHNHALSRLIKVNENLEETMFFI